MSKPIIRYEDRQVGNYYTLFEIEMLDDGTAVDLSVGTLTITMWDQSDDSVVISAATATNANADGTGDYQPVSGDVDTAGDYLVQWTYDNGSSRVYKSPLIKHRIVANPS